MDRPCVCRYDTAFQSFTPEEDAWLNRREHEGAKEVAIETIRLCIDLVLPASTPPAIPRLGEDEKNDILKLRQGMCYPTTTFKSALDINVMTALEIHKLSEIVGDDSAFAAISDSFLKAAQEQYDRLVADGMPNGLRPWLRLVPRSD